MGSIGPASAELSRAVLGAGGVAQVGALASGNSQLGRASSLGYRTAQNPFIGQPLGMRAPIERGGILKDEVPRTETARIGYEDNPTGAVAPAGRVQYLLLTC